MKRIFIPLRKALKDAHEMYGYPDDYGIMACYEIENMGFCKDGRTRWYHFISVDGVPAYTLKYWSSAGLSAIRGEKVVSLYEY